MSPTDPEPPMTKEFQANENRYIRRTIQSFCFVLLNAILGEIPGITLPFQESSTIFHPHRKHRTK